MSEMYIFYVLLMRFSDFSVLKFGITRRPKERIKQHRSSSDNPFGERPDQVVVVGEYPGREEEIRASETALKAHVLRMVFPHPITLEDMDHIAIPNDGVPSGEWLFKPSTPGDGADLIDYFNELVAGARMAHLLIGFRPAARGINAFDCHSYPTVSLSGWH